MSLRLLSLIFVRLVGWLTLLARSTTWKDAELTRSDVSKDAESLFCVSSWRCCVGRSPDRGRRGPIRRCRRR